MVYYYSAAEVLRAFFPETMREREERERRRRLEEATEAAFRKAAAQCRHNGPLVPCSACVVACLRKVGT